MKSSFQDGVDSIYNAIVGQGTTPSGKTPAQLVAGIGTLATNKYNAGNSAGYTSGYSAGMAAAVVNINNISIIHQGAGATITFSKSGTVIISVGEYSADGTVSCTFSNASSRTLCHVEPYKGRILAVYAASVAAGSTCTISGGPVLYALAIYV